MPHGQPDFGMYQLAETIYRLSDMGELAVRLGSIVSYDRRGDVIFMDDFEGGGQKWFDPTAYIVVSTDYAFSGSFSCKLTPPLGTGLPRQIATLLFPSVLSKMGFEATLMLHSDVNITGIAFQHNVDGAAHLYHIRHQIAAQTLEYQTGTFDYTEFANGLLLQNGDPTWHKFKMVVNLVTNKFERLMIDAHTFDVSTLSPLVGSTGNRNSLTALIKCNRTEGGTKSFYVDNVIITQNEP